MARNLETSSGFGMALCETQRYVSKHHAAWQSAEPDEIRETPNEIRGSWFKRHAAARDGRWRGRMPMCPEHEKTRHGSIVAGCGALPMSDHTGLIKSKSASHLYSSGTHADVSNVRASFNSFNC